MVDKAATKEACGKVEDEGLAALMAPYREELSAYVNTPIGTLINSDLSKDSGLKGISGIYTGSSGIMNLLGTACNYYSGADVIFLCTDYENAGFPVGNVSIKNISASYSYSGGTVTVYEATGEQLMKLLEWCASFFNRMEDGDLIVSYNPERRESKYSSNFIGTGICYDIDLTQDAGSRIRNLALIRKDKNAMPARREDGSLETTPIEADTRIKLTTNNYYMKQWLTAGGCLEDETMNAIYSSSEEFGDDDGTIGLHNSETGRSNIKSINAEDIKNYYLSAGWNVNRPPFYRFCLYAFSWK